MQKLGCESKQKSAPTTAVGSYVSQSPSIHRRTSAHALHGKLVLPHIKSIVGITATTITYRPGSAIRYAPPMNNRLRRVHSSVTAYVVQTAIGALVPYQSLQPPIGGSGSGGGRFRLCLTSITIASSVRTVAFVPHTKPAAGLRTTKATTPRHRRRVDGFNPTLADITDAAGVLGAVVDGSAQRAALLGIDGGGAGIVGWGVAA
jgi:hypothetical protein